MNSTNSIRLLALACMTLFGAAATAATVTVVNVDGPNEGFNDPTPVAPLPSNPEVTLGAQRLRVVQTAADQWGALLESSVEIRVRVGFNPLTCSGTSAVLGSAGATTIHANFANAPFPDTWYSGALANALSGTDINGANEEINSQYNSNYDSGTCITGTAGWYYSTLQSDPTPTNRTALLPVVFHEFAHGLGFQTFTNSSSGQFASGTVGGQTIQLPDVWTRHLMDVSSRQRWIQLTATQRQASAISDPNLVWAGPNVRVDKSLYLTPAPKLFVNSPAAIAGIRDAQPASFGPNAPQAGITGNMVLVDDGTGTIRDGCEMPFVNAAAVAGNIALIERGLCNFTVKVKNAQLAGATAAIIFNNVASGLPGMGGSDNTVIITSYGISQADGNAILGQLPAPGVNATLGFDPSGALSGVNAGFVRMNAPNPVQPGSSVSHWTIDTFPNLLMEPAINANLFSDVDLTIPLFRDIGWNDNAPPGIYIFEGGFEEF